ncbi:MAG: hypothetical protein ABJE66_02380 [Deltaproteobacteria bacterium]
MSSPMSAWAFHVFMTIVTGGVSAIWFAVDLRNLLRARTLDGTNPSIRDRKFGYSMGLVIATIGVVGSTVFWL